MEMVISFFQRFWSVIVVEESGVELCVRESVSCLSGPGAFVVGSGVSRGEVCAVTTCVSAQSPRQLVPFVADQPFQTTSASGVLSTEQLALQQPHPTL